MAGLAGGDGRLMELWQVTGLVVTVAAFAVVVTNIIRDYRDPYVYLRVLKEFKTLVNDQVKTSLRLLETETLLREHELGHEVNVRHMERRGVAPAWRPTRTLKRIMNGGSRLLPVYELLYERFSDDELFDLAFRVGIGRGELMGDTHSARAQGLIEYAARHELVDELLAAGREVRPELGWPGNMEG